MSDTAQRLDDLFARALELDPAGRDAWLRAECASDPELLAEVASLLRAHEAMGRFLDTPAAESLGELQEPSLEPGGRIGAYRIERLLGRGGAGAVYLADQARPRRRVALKIMRADVASAVALRRFLDEAEILARLRHPGVETVYEAGVHEGIPYIAMEYVEGARTILEHAGEARLDTRRRVELLARVCDAVHHGHLKGVIHRDLKPGNVLVDASGEPKVIDFGIAHLQDADRPAHGGFAGTLPYASPEACASGADVDVQSDVYALGVLLYELLSGRLPHEVDDTPISEALRRIREEEPAPLHRRHGADLAAITRKALAKDRQRRYASAAALADDLRRFLEERPVEAHAPVLFYPLYKFARRQRLAFLALLAVAGLTVAGGVAGTVLAVANARARKEAEFQAYVANVAAAAAALRVNDVAEARQRLEHAPKQLRDWEWRYLHARLDRSCRTLSWPGARVTGATASADGRLVAVSGQISGQPYRVSVWDLASGEIVRTRTLAGRRRADALALGPGHRDLALGLSDGTLELRDALTGALRWSVGAHRDVVIAVAFNPAGDRLATTSRDKTIKLWNAENGDVLQTLRGHTDRVISVAFSADGRRIVSGGREGAIRLWDAERGGALSTLAGHESSVEGVALSPADDRLASVSRDRTVRLWDPRTGTLLATRREHTSNVRWVAFHPDGQSFATASWDRTIRIWDAAGGRELACLSGHESRLVHLAYLDGGAQLLSVALDGTAKLWDLAAAATRTELLGHDDLVSAVAFSPDGRYFASGARNGTIRLWDATARTAVAVLRGHSAWIEALAFLPDGRLVSLARNGGMRVWACPGGALLRTLPGARAVAVGSRAYLSGSRGWIAVWDTERWERLRRWRAASEAVTHLALSRDGRLLASGTSGGEVAVWDTGSRGKIAATTVRGPVQALAFSPAGRLLATAHGTGPPLLRDARTLEISATLRGHAGAVHALAFSADGTRLATGGTDATVRLWDVERGRQVAVLTGHRFPVWCAAFSPGGTRLATGDGSTEDAMSAVRVWEAPR